MKINQCIQDIHWIWLKNDIPVEKKGYFEYRLAILLPSCTPSFYNGIKHTHDYQSRLKWD